MRTNNCLWQRTEVEVEVGVAVVDAVDIVLVDDVVAAAAAAVQHAVAEVIGALLTV